MGIIQPPAHLSDEARAYLLEPPEPVPAVDYRDADAMVDFRTTVHEEWASLDDSIEGDWVSHDDVAGGVPVRWFAATDEHLDSDDVVVHLHGGAYILGSVGLSAPMTVPLAQRTGLPVVSVDYRLAPEHRCPAAIEDAVAVCGAIGGSKRIRALYGESAGGGLAVATAVSLRDAGGPMPDKLGLLSPWVDLTTSGDGYRTLVHVDPDFPDPTEPPQWAAAYAGDGVADPNASPLFAELAGLPPALIQVGGREILLSDSCRLARALRDADVESELDIWDGLWHVWHLWHHVPEAQQAWNELARFIMED